MAFLWSALTEGHGSVGATIAACGVAANWAAGMISGAREEQSDSSVQTIGSEAELFIIC
jgi:hypothetical protein